MDQKLSSLSSLQSESRQRGAALVTTMVFLIVLTVIVVSTMQNNRQDQRMAFNIQELNHAFQYGESGLVPGIQSPDLLATGPDPMDFSPPDNWLCSTGDPATPVDCNASSATGNAAIETGYRGRGNLPPKNFSLESGFISHYFIVASQGRSQNTLSTHTVGIALVGPDDLGN